MTTIAASRLHGEMAADTQMNCGYSIFPSKKIYVSDHGLVGAAGSSIDCSKFLEWVGRGMDKESIPSLDAEDGFQALVMRHDALFFFEKDCFPLKIERDFHAIGSGGDAALAAMFCGKTPKRAVEIAAKVNNLTGGPITVLVLDT